MQTSPDEAILRFARALARQAAREDFEKEHAPEETRNRAAIYARFSTGLQNERSIEDWACIMSRKAAKPNPEASVCKYVAKYGLAAHLFYNSDGSVVAVKLSKPGSDTGQHTDDETSEDLRKLL